MFTINTECYITLTIYSTRCCLTRSLTPGDPSGILKHNLTKTRQDQAGPGPLGRVVHI